MKSDFITLVPAIAFDIGENLVKQNQFPNRFNFGNSLVFSYKDFAKGEVSLSAYQRDQLTKVFPTIINGKGESLDDFICIYDKNIPRNKIEPYNSPAEDLILYFAFRQGLANWIHPETVKIECMHGAGRRIYIGDLNELFSPTYKLLVPSEQNIRIRYTNDCDVVTRTLSQFKAKREDQFNRFMRAIRLHNTACKTEHSDKSAAIVLLAGALEALFDYPPPSTRDKFSYAARTHIGFDENVQIWAKEFYELRSNIVHGAETQPERLYLSGSHKDKTKQSKCTRHQNHFEIAKDVFDEVLFAQLENMGYIKASDDYKDERVRVITHKIIPNIDKISAILNKDFSYDNFKKDLTKYKQFLSRIEYLTATDYSATKKIRKVVNLICTISIQWIDNDLLPELAQQKAHRNLNDSTIKAFNFREQSLLKIREHLKALTSVKDGVELNNAISKMIELCCKANPIWHHKTTYNFTITEFLERSFRALFATFQQDIG